MTSNRVLKYQDAIESYLNHLLRDCNMTFKELNDPITIKNLGQLVEMTMKEICSPYEIYRNKMDYTFSNKRWLTIEEVASDLKIEEPALGFHVPKRFDKIIEIEKCYLQDDRANDIRNETAKFTKANGYDYYDIRQNTGLMRNLIIRNTSTNEWMVIVVFAADEQEKIAALLSHLKNTFSFITSLLYVINTKKNDTIFDLPNLMVDSDDNTHETSA